MMPLELELQEWPHLNTSSSTIIRDQDEEGIMMFEGIVIYTLFCNW